MIASENLIKTLVGLEFSNRRSTLFTYRRQKYLGALHLFFSNQEVYANPLPHVLILTAIVVGVATIALG